VNANATLLREQAVLFRQIARSWRVVSEFDAADRNEAKAKACEVTAEHLEREEVENPPQAVSA
jgi:hypothetical protein